MRPTFISVSATSATIFASVARGPPGGPGQAFAQYQCLVQATKPDQGIHSAEPDHAGSPLVAEQAHHHFGVLTIDHGLQVVPADGEVTDGLQRTVRVRG